MNTLDKITQDLKLWEKEYTTAKKEYDQFVTEYEESHPNFANRLEKAWKETTEVFWGIEVKYKKGFKKASQQKEPQRSLDRYQAKLLKKMARTQAIRKYEEVKEELLKEAVLHNDAKTEIPERFKKLKVRYRKAKIQKANLQKSLNRFLNSGIFKEQEIELTDFQFSH